jgi:hypothetical protein
MMAAAVTPDRDNRKAMTQVLFEDRFELGTIDTANYDITPDQARFVMVWAGERGSAQSVLHVVINWWGTRSASSPQPR